jgi:nicotinamidase-related amidase
MILIDHQPLQFAGVQNIDRTLLVNSVVGLAKTAKVFGVPTILTTVLEQRGGYLLRDIQDVFPDQKPINRTTLNTWEDERVVNVVKKIGRKKLVIAALWTEIGLAYPVLSALATRCSSSQMPQAVSAWRRTKGPCSAWCKPVRLPSHGSDSQASCSATGRERRR